ncbi:hypothetical protein, variant [Exophiala mesophila]|nr:hypothetical protein, variant [Exophiala mesophila]KIV98205.1 hypothetical protein, variant [Exophiala mesophila]
MYSQHSRNMLPPSPQHYPPQRFSQPPLPAPPSSTAPQNPPVSYHKRPGSSMSISSMLGVAEPDRAPPDQQQIPTSREPSRQSSSSGPPLLLGAAMSPPPAYASKHASNNDHMYNQRSNTPDRMDTTSPTGTRPHRSSSGNTVQRAASFYDPHPRSTPNSGVMGGLPGPRYPSPFAPAHHSRDDYGDRNRRTSISGILQRPESQPQLATSNPPFHSGPSPHPRPESIPSLLHSDRPGPEPPRQTPHAGTYDTRPPGLPALSRLPVNTPSQQSYQSPYDRPVLQSLSPEIRRSHLNGTESRGLAPILNQQNDGAHSFQQMARQDSMQSQSDRSLAGDRSRAPNRPYSPFAGSVVSHNNQAMGEVMRKGSEELSQHRAILSLAHDSKRGRYSPVPQAVQGAQAQTPVPDAGIKTEQGRVFSGIGGALGTASQPQTSTPQPMSASPFKQNDSNSKLSEENLVKMSRTASGASKRARKAMDEDSRGDGESTAAKKNGTSKTKRGKYQHSYKLDLDEAAQPQKKPGSFTSTEKASHPRSTAGTGASNPQPLANLATSRHVSSAEPKPSSRKIIKISSVVASAAKNPRRHLGFFKYNPQVTPIDSPRPSTHKFDVSIRPNLIPSFQQPENINCTYTIRVSRMWLKERERRLIGAERYLWGSGIYTDDSDPIAAAMHSGFITAVPPSGVDEVLLDQIIREQNSKIEGGSAPEKPAPVPENKDLHITLVVLPALERYAESARFGIKSRSWPDESCGSETKTPHDGVSFMVLKTEFLEDGIESQRVGRTGVEKRERLRRELQERQRGLELEKQKLLEAAARATLRKRRQKQGVTDKDAVKVTSTELLSSLSKANEAGVDDVGDSSPKLDVGQSPGEWIRQLTVAAA